MKATALSAGASATSGLAPTTAVVLATRSPVADRETPASNVSAACPLASSGEAAPCKKDLQTTQWGIYATSCGDPARVPAYAQRISRSLTRPPLSDVLPL